MYNSNYILVRNAEQNFMQTRVGVIGNELICNISIVVLEYHCDQRKIVEMREREREIMASRASLSLPLPSLFLSHLQRLQHRSQKYLGVSSRTHAGALVRTLRAFIYNSMLKKSDSTSRVAHTSSSSSSSLSSLSFYGRRGKNVARVPFA